MAIELPKDKRKEAIASIIQFFQESREEKIGNIAASGVLDFFLAEIAPTVYNEAVAGVVERMQRQIAEIDADFNEAEFSYWTGRSR